MDALSGAKVTQIPGWAPSVNLEVKDYVATGEESEEDRPKSSSTQRDSRGDSMESAADVFFFLGSPCWMYHDVSIF